MFIHEAIKQIIAANSGVTDLVGERVTPGKLHQSVRADAIAFRLIPRNNEPLLNSRGTGPTKSPFIFYCVATSAKRAAEIDEALRLCLQGYSGLVTLDGSSPADSMRINGIFFEASEEAYDDVTETYQVASIYSIHHDQQVPA